MSEIKIGDRVRAEGVVWDYPDKGHFWVQFDGGSDQHRLVAGEMIKIDDRPFRVRKKSDGEWLSGPVAPMGSHNPAIFWLVNQEPYPAFVASKGKAYVWPPRWRPVFEADLRFELVPVDPEPASTFEK